MVLYKWSLPNFKDRLWSSRNATMCSFGNNTFLLKCIFSSLLHATFSVSYIMPRLLFVGIYIPMAFARTFSLCLWHNQRHYHLCWLFCPSFFVFSSIGLCSNPGYLSVRPLCLQGHVQSWLLTWNRVSFKWYLYCVYFKFRIVFTSEYSGNMPLKSCYRKRDRLIWLLFGAKNQIQATLWLAF